MTICCSGESSALFLNSKSPIARDRARLPFTLPKSTKPPAAHIRAFSPSLKSAMHWTTRSQLCLTFILRLVIERQWFRSAFDTKYRSRITSVRLCILAVFEKQSRLQLTTKICVLVIRPTEAVQPETSSSYLGSAHTQLPGCDFWLNI